MAQRQLETLIDKYNTADAKCNTELEARLDGITAEEFARLIAAAKEKYGAPGETRSVNIISDDIPGSSQRQTTYIVTNTYVGNKLQTTTYSTKTKIGLPARVNDYINYRVAIAEECATPKFATSHGAVIRYKNRLSYTIELTDMTWRLDLTITATRNIRDNSDELKRVREATMGAKTMLDSALPDSAYEVELELVRAGRAVSVADLDVVRDIFILLNPNYRDDVAYGEQMFNIALAMGSQSPNMFRSTKHRLKQLVPQVIAINKGTYRALGDIEGYFATLKLDGERVIVSVNDNVCYIMMSMRMMTFSIAEKTSNNTIVDGEIMFDGEDFAIHAFDVIKHDDEPFYGGIEARIEHLEAACKTISRYLPKRSSCTAKKYVKLKDLSADLTALWAQVKDGAVQLPGGKSMHVDGIIISAPGKPYLETMHYKWKPVEQNTIDFVAKKCPDALIGTPPYVTRRGETCYMLFVGIRHTVRELIGPGLVEGYRGLFPDVKPDYYPVQFSPSVDPLAYIWYATEDDLDGKIVELSLVDGAWKFHRVRDDRKIGERYYGNDFYVAETTYMNYVDKFPLSSLWEVSDDYFKKNADVMYRASNGYKRYVITTIIDANFRNIDSLIDAAAGRGADVARFRIAGVRRLLALDIDRAAIGELVERKYSKKGGGAGVYDRFPTINSRKVIAPAESMAISAAVMDLGANVDENIERCVRYGFIAGTVNGVVCNFALHYFCTNLATISRFFKFAAAMCAPGAKFVFTVMDGAKIIKLPNAWKVVENSKTKYEIVRKFTGTALKPFGQIITVRLPFSDALMEEPLCNIAEVINVAKAAGFSDEKVVGFGTHLDDFAKANAAMWNELTEGDREYIAMHSYVVLTSNK